MDLTFTVADRVVDRLKRDGFKWCTRQDVFDVWEHGACGDAALSSAIIRELEEYGVL